jgi:hypothetical protein
MLRLDRNTEDGSHSMNVGELISRQDVDTNVSDDNTLTDKVKINLNMLDVLVLNGVSGEVDGVDVVTVDRSDPRQGAMQLHKQLSKPTCLCHAVGLRAALRLSARTGDDGLTL